MLKKALEHTSKRTVELAHIEKGIEAFKREGALKDGDDNHSALKSLLEKSRASLKVVHDIQPTTGSLFVRLFLGKVNVREASTGDCEALRSEYEKFRFRTSFGFIVLPAIWFFNYIFLRHT